MLLLYIYNLHLKVKFISDLHLDNLRDSLEKVVSQTI